LKKQKKIQSKQPRNIKHTKKKTPKEKSPDQHLNTSNKHQQKQCTPTSIYSRLPKNPRHAPTHLIKTRNVPAINPGRKETPIPHNQQNNNTTHTVKKPQTTQTPQTTIYKRTPWHMFKHPAPHHPKKETNVIQKKETTENI